MENMLFLQTYIEVIQKAKDCTRNEAILLMTEGSQVSTRLSTLEAVIFKEDFSAIFQEFLSPSSGAELNVSNLIVTELEIMLAQNASTVPLRCLDALKKEVLTMVYENTFKGWIAHCRSTLTVNQTKFSRNDLVSSKMDIAGISMTRSANILELP